MDEILIHIVRKYNLTKGVSDGIDRGMKETNTKTTETLYASKAGETLSGYIVGDDYLDLGKIESIEVQEWSGEPHIVLMVSGELVSL